MSFTCLSNIFNSSRRACFALLAYNNFSSKSKRLFSFSSLRPLIKPNLYVNPQNAPIIAENIFITFKIFLLSFLDFLDIFFLRKHFAILLIKNFHPALHSPREYFADLLMKFFQLLIYWC
nr:MAG TPA: hypothetical protein [Caudoviricetes sp.]